MGDFILGKDIRIQTDHKPLVPLFGSKNLDEIPPRIQRFRMRLMKYSFNICHIPGKDLVIANTLSRAPLRKLPTKTDIRLYEDLNLYVANILEGLPATERRVDFTNKMMKCAENYKNSALKDGLTSQN